MPLVPKATLDLDAIEDRAAKATPGPWATDLYALFVLAQKVPGGMICDLGVRFKDEPQPPGAVDVVRIRGFGASLPQAANMEFVANARSDIPALCAEVRRLRALLRHEMPRHEGDIYQTPEERAEVFLAGWKDRDRREMGVADLAALAREAAWEESEEWMEEICGAFPEVHDAMGGHGAEPETMPPEANDTTKPFHYRWPRILRAWADWWVARAKAAPHVDVMPLNPESPE
jgi:hypothetical protein